MSKLISDAVNAKLNEQVKNEFGASHAYLAMSAAFDSMGLKILAARFLEQSEEEREHALKIFKYIQDVGGDVALTTIPEPKAKFETAKDIIKAALDSELTVTQQINNLVALADKEKDYATRSFLNWFVDEQVEEVQSMRDLLQWSEMVRDVLYVENLVRHQMASKG
jgi:ferritin